MRGLRVDGSGERFLDRFVVLHQCKFGEQGKRGTKARDRLAKDRLALGGAVDRAEALGGRSSVCRARIIEAVPECPVVVGTVPGGG